jgi:hypothetical protein
MTDDSGGDEMGWRIAGWKKHFENNRTRELKKMEWVPLPNRMDDAGYVELLDHRDGAAHFGAWVALVEIASRCRERGSLTRDGSKAHTYNSLARISRIPEELFRAAIPRLMEMGWLELSEDVPSVREFTNTLLQQKAYGEIPQEGAEIPQEGAVDPHEQTAATPQEGAVLPRARLGKGMEGNGTEDTIPGGLSVDELESAWERHAKYRHQQPKELVFRRIIAMNGQFSVERFRERHETYCLAMTRTGWRFCALTFLDWVEAGMPLPPPDPPPETGARGRHEQAFEAANRRRQQS